MIEIPVYFNGPEDEVKAIDPYKEFIVEEVADITVPEENRVSSGTIKLDDVIKDDVTIKSIINRTGESLQNKATELASMDEEFIESIEERMKREISERRDYFYDKNGVKHTKDQYLPFDKLSTVIKTVDEVYGTLCVDGIQDLDFDISFSESMLKDMLKSGLETFAECFLNNTAIDNIKTIVSNSIISMGTSIVSTNGPSTIKWIDDNLGTDAASLLEDDFLETVVSKYEIPPEMSNITNELSRIENSLNSVKSDWYYFENEAEQSFEKTKTDIIKKLSDGAKNVFSTDEKYIESLTVAEAYDVAEDFSNPLTIR